MWREALTQNAPDTGAGWGFVEQFKKEAISGGENDWTVGPIYSFLIRFLVPVLAVVLVVWWLYLAARVCSGYPVRSNGYLQRRDLPASVGYRADDVYSLEQEISGGNAGSSSCAVRRMNPEHVRSANQPLTRLKFS
jgi:hypothetical protein